MMTLMKTVLTAVGLLFLLMGLAGASEYAFGTKVLPGDNDIGRPLFSLPAGTTVAFWDTGVVPGYDDSDVVYLVTPPVASLTVKANDVRLTSFGMLQPGSKVTPLDNDIGMPLTLFPSGSSICYLDLFGSQAYDLGDPVYVHRGSAFVTLVNDIRLNVTSGFGLMPGTKLCDFEPDLNRVIRAALVPLPKAPGSSLAFFDVNGNGVYDYWDDVYMNVPAGAPGGAVAVNNVRLSGPV